MDTLDSVTDQANTRIHMDRMSQIQKDLCAWHNLLVDASSKVADCYILLPIAGKTDSEYRERVYCYELYHQLRVLGEERHLPYVLGGEIDKAGHPVIRGPYLDRSKPDLAAHRPGRMSHNLSVVEIKPAGATAPQIADDLRKLTAFRSLAAYHSAYFILYGGKKSAFHRALHRIAGDPALARDVDFGLIRLMWHQKAGMRASELRPPF